MTSLLGLTVLRSNVSNTTSKIVQGSSYSNYGGKRRGEVSVLDSDINNLNALEQEKRLKSSYQVAHFQNGQIIDNATIEEEGKIFHAKNGLFNYIDKEAVEVRASRYRQQQEYINKISDYCVWNNDLSAEVLGFATTAEYITECKAVIAGASFPDASSGGDHDCSAEAIKGTPPESPARYAKLTKLKLLVAKYLPLMKGGTKTADLFDANDKK